MADGPSSDVKLEIAHVLFIDIVGYSKRLVDEQHALVEKLNRLVRSTDQFRQAEAVGKLISMPTGDGMALAFFNAPDAPVRCAIELSKADQEDPKIELRIGIHSGPVDRLGDVNQRENIAGTGINMAQRVMECGDGGHILLSNRVADDLAQYGHWRQYLHDLGQVEVKHGVRLGIANFYSDEFGNAATPAKVADQIAKNRRAVISRRRCIALIAAAIVIVLAVAAATLYQRSKRRSPLANQSDKSIAVLPLENLSDEKENAYFADGVQDELLSDLAKIKDLKVISRTSVMQYKAGITRNLKEIAQQLGVSNIIEGSVRRSGNHLRISVQLIDALTDRHIWAQNYDRTVADSVALQGELATEIASQVGATLSPQEKARVEATPTKNTAAYDAYLQGRALAAGLTTDFSNEESAAQSFQQAVTLDPSFALAWAYLSCAQSLIYWAGSDSTPARLASAKNAADRALALDPNLPEAHLALGYYRYYGLRDFSGALAEFQIAEKSLPNNVDVLMAIGFIQRRLGHWDELIAASRRVVELDPRNIQAAGSLAITYMAKRQFGDALTALDRALAVDSSNEQIIEDKVWCLWAVRNFDAADLMLAKPGIKVHLRGHQALIKGDPPQAVDLFSKALEDAHGDEKRELLLDLGFSQQRAGNVADAKATFQEALQEVTKALSNVIENSGPAAGLHSDRGIVYAALGDAASAVKEGRIGMAMQPNSEDPEEGPEREEQMAQIYALLGNADEAIPIIKRVMHTTAFTETRVGLMYTDPMWDRIRNDPRFVELLTEKKDATDR